MYVIAKYAEGTGHPAFMDLFKTRTCSVDFTSDGYVCHIKLSYEEFISWYNNNNMTQHTWVERETELLSSTLVLVNGRRADIDEQMSIYLAEDDSLISDRQAKDCGLWAKILDQLYAQRPTS